MKSTSESETNSSDENPYASPGTHVRGGGVEVARAFEKLQPIKTIWFHPRRTLQTLFKFDTSYGSLVLVSMLWGGLIWAQQETFNSNQGMPVGSVIVLTLLGGAVLGIGGLFVFALFLKWTGRAMSGHGSMKELRVALAWGGFPMSLCILLSVWNLMFSFERASIISIPRLIDEDLTTAIISSIENLISFAMFTWSLILTSNTVAEAQDFRSAWIGFANLIMALLCLLVPYLAILLVILALAG